MVGYVYSLKGDYPAPIPYLLNASEDTVQAGGGFPIGFAVGSKNMRLTWFTGLVQGFGFMVLFCIYIYISILMF